MSSPRFGDGSYLDRRCVTRGLPVIRIAVRGVWCKLLILLVPRDGIKPPTPIFSHLSAITWADSPPRIAAAIAELMRSAAARTGSSER
jgi:hypothetical protein